DNNFQGSGFLQSYPALVKPLKIGGNKWLGGYPGNIALGLPVISALIIINDGETGRVLAVLQGEILTAMRTAGHSAVGAGFLAREKPEVLSIIGCGLEGRAHIKTMSEVFPVKLIKVFDISSERERAFIEEMSQIIGAEISACRTAEEAVSGADIICLVTSSREPVLREAWIDKGALVCAINGFLDLDPYCAIKFDKWVLGCYKRDLEWIEGDEVGKNSPQVVPYTAENIYADIATEIVLNKKPGRQTDKERIVFTHHGMPALDIAVSALVYEEAIKQGIGTAIKIN
ncbi:MAG: hypothetical protein DRP87_08690, partial [Spirochaetes bacterium]